MTANSMPQDSRLYFVGSVPLASGRDVMSMLAPRFGKWLRRIPDGETGERTHWIQYQEDVFARVSVLEKVLGDVDPRTATASRPQAAKFRLRAGATLAASDLGPLGYAASILESWREFQVLRAEGVISPTQRFVVALPSPYNVISFSIASEAQAAVEPAYEARLFEELDEILAEIPAESLTLQWDCAHDMQAFDGARIPWFAPARGGIISRLARCAARAPAGAELGYHFCYGSYGGRHFVEPVDMRAMVDLANGLFAAAPRSIQFIHMPVPVERDDDAYFAPLRDLHAPEAFDLYLGLIHTRDGLPGNLKRYRTALRHSQRFGVGTECGFGRMSPDAVPAIMQAHEELMRSLDAEA